MPPSGHSTRQYDRGMPALRSASGAKCVWQFVFGENKVGPRVGPTKMETKKQTLKIRNGGEEENFERRYGENGAEKRLSACGRRRAESDVGCAALYRVARVLSRFTSFGPQLTQRACATCLVSRNRPQPGSVYDSPARQGAQKWEGMTPILKS